MAQRGDFQDVAVRLCKNSKNGSNGCVNWTGYTVPDGYGSLRIGTGRSKAPQYRAHRVAASVWLGFDLGSPLCVLHKCDNPCCINPDHLFIGTRADNNNDCITKGRSADTRGENHGGSRLTVHEVGAIRRLCVGGVPQKTVAREYGIDPSQVSNIVLHKAWRHID